ncbi:MAG: cupin domain-containing protein [candidate division Zixibacteria bacterium]|nr:cupin domain-containing protein [candidate division Zixibacteria bacterium]
MRIEIGQHIKDLRLAAELTQAELADRSGLTKGFISQVENDQTSISLDSMIDIMDALGTTISEFFAEDDEEDRITFDHEDRVIISDKGATAFELLVPGSTNMLMDPIEVKLEPGESLSPEAPHYGEEFGFVQSGLLAIKFGKRTYKVKKGNCFYFTAEKKHQFLNTGKVTTSFIWVVSPPQM